MINRDRIREAFANYTSHYDPTDSKIALKIKHTYKVAGLCEEIAESLGLSEEDVDLAWMCGMLHDIGRFEQVTRYGTFIDGQSVNHAMFGADLLFQEGLYDQIVGGAEEWKDITEKAIRAHNMFRIPDTLTEREVIFANILRDADKIDILRANCETPREEIYNVSTSELRKSAVSQDVRDAFLEGRCALRRNDNTPVDHMVGHICFTFELVYPISKRLMFEQGYLYELLDFESDNPETAEWFGIMRERMKKMEQELRL